MRIFITWSGEQSKAVATALREWIPDVINAARTWMSASDIGAGERWDAAISRELADSSFGILCLVPTNLREPWIHFEAGAIAKAIDNAYVCPYLLNLEPSDIPGGPLARFQAKRADREGTLELLETINQALGQERLPKERLLRVFERCWPDLERQLKAARGLNTTLASRRSPEDMLQEVLNLVRALSQKDVSSSLSCKYCYARDSGARPPSSSGSPRQDSPTVAGESIEAMPDRPGISPEMRNEMRG